MADEHVDGIMNRVASEAVPPVDGAFANRLEADLREQSLQGARPLRQPTWWWRPSTVVALGLVVLVIGLAVGVIGNTPTTVEITTAQGSSISVPGAADLVEGQPGMELEDGTRIEVGPGGLITVGGVVLGEGTTAVIEEGSVAILGESPLPTTTLAPPVSSEDGATTVRPTPKTGTLTPTSTPPTTIGDSAPDTIAPDTTIPRTTIPKSTLPPETKPTTTEPPKTSTTAPGTTVPETRPQTTLPVGLAIGVEFVDVGERVATLTWSIRETDVPIAGWIVQVKRGDGIANLATMRRPEARSVRVELTAQSLEYRVVVRGEGGAILGESRWISPGV